MRFRLYSKKARHLGSGDGLGGGADPAEADGLVLGGGSSFSSEKCQQDFAFFPKQANKAVWRSGFATPGDVGFAQNDRFDRNALNSGFGLAQRDTFHVDNEVADVLIRLLKSQQSGGFTGSNRRVVGRLRKAASGQQPKNN